MILFFISSLFTGTSHAEEIEGGDCVMCHETIEPLVDKAAIDNSVHAGFDCTDCHQDVTEIPHGEAPKKVQCSACHSEIATEYSESIHYEAISKGDGDAPDCTSCHGAHDILGKNNPRSRTNPLNIPATCSKCHTSEKITRQHPLPSPEFIRSYSESVHGRGVLVSGLVVSAVCSDCHGSHDIRPKTDKKSLVYRDNIPLTCRKCHLGIYDDYEISIHGQLWKQGIDVGPVCTTCHKSHEIKEPVSTGFRLQISDECGGCHAARQLTYQDTFHGQSTSLGFVQVAKCSDCHKPHLNLPRDNPLSSIYPANLIGTCGRCHPGIGGKFVSYDPHADPRNRDRSPLLFYVYSAMNWLLISVFGFFGLHLFLWLQRSAVAVARGEINTRWNSGKYVLRFTVPHRVAHVAVVVSFLGLAATGLPLMYNDTGWGRFLEAILGGVEVTRYFHRLLAVVTLGYVGLHVGYLLDKIFLKGNISLLYGPNSMIPRRRDLVDLYQNILWFLYLGPRPKLDRWTYWEKFDYFAVFWGIPVIGISGLMLWFPEIFTKVLPGYFLNLAMVVHGEEALLAVGFIFTFHFFHTHLRPESFPLDTAIFTGKVPIERFMEERPEEYNRLLIQGNLEHMVVEPPSQLAIMLSKWFGFTALGVGLILIVAIFATFLANI